MFDTTGCLAGVVYQGEGNKPGSRFIGGPDWAPSPTL